MLKKLFSAGSRTSKKYQQQFSAGDSKQRLRVLQELKEAITTGELTEIGPELKVLFSSALAREHNPELKVALLPWIDDPALLTPLLDDDTTAQLAARRLVQLTPIDSPLNQNPWVMTARFTHVSADQVRALTKIAVTPEHMAILAIRAHMDDLDFVLNQPLLNCELGLIALEKTSRGRNKTCHKHARERLDDLKRHRRSKDDAQQRLHELDTTIAKLVAQQQQERPDLAGLIRDKTRLRLLAEKRQIAANELLAALQKLDDAPVIDASTILPESPLRGFDLAIPDASEDLYQNIVDVLKHFFTEAKEHGTSFEHASSLLQQTNENWRTQAVAYSPSATQQQAFDELSSRLNRYATKLQDLENFTLYVSELPNALTANEIASATTELAKHRQQWLRNTTQAIKKLAWPADLPLPEIVKSAQTALVRVKGEMVQLTEQQTQTREKLKEFIANTEAQFTNGQLKQAIQSLAQARKLQRLGYRDCDTEINTLSGELGEMSDWQNYATEPKRQALLENLQSLADSPLAAPDQAERLKQLREQWNSLGPLRRSDKPLQNRFDALAEQAFAPCKTYFAEQTERRKANLQNRQSVCAQLAELIEQDDWRQIPLQKIEAISRQARAEWQSHHPCDRRALKPVEARFEALQNQLHEHIRQCKHENLERKQNIIDNARALMNVASNKEATQQAKQLQQQWQKIGPAPRNAERRAWEAFRQACDAVFERSAAAYQASQEALTEQKNAIDAALDDFEEYIKADDLAGLRTKYQAIENQAASLKLTSATTRRINAANQTLKDLARAAKKTENVQRLEQWQAWDLEVSAAEQTGVVVDPPHSVFAARCKNKAESEDLHRLTLEAEIAADIASPAADQQARVAFQVELINKGLSNLALIDNRQLIERWCASGPKAASDDSLRARFFSALTQRL